MLPAMANTTKSLIEAAQYVSLESYKPNGGAVQTPVWCAPFEDRLVVFTNVNSYKVKRLRRQPDLKLAPCNARGTVHGPWVAGSATIHSDAEENRSAFRALLKKYTWQMGSMMFFARFTGRHKQWVILQIQLEQATPDPDADASPL